MSTKVLIAGASGLVGTVLTKHFITSGYEVNHLNRRKYGTENATEFLWNPDNGDIDTAAFQEVNYVINLAGGKVSKGRWTEARKKELLLSRTKPLQLIVDYLNNNEHQVKKLVTASGAGYYGTTDKDIVFEESYPPGKDFLAGLTVEWENVVKEGLKNLPYAILRIGVVFSSEGGALQELEKPIKFFVGAPLGSGKQFVPWIHEHDLARMFKEVLKNDQLTGPINAVAPEHINNKALTKILGKVLGRPIWPFSVPGFVLKILLGEMAGIVVAGNKVSCAKMLNAGFEFQYPNVKDAVKETSGKKN